MRLLESEAAPERRPGGTTASMVLHVALIAGAVVASARQAPVERAVEIPPELVYRAPVRTPEPPLVARGNSATGASTTTTTTRTVAVPTTVPDGLPAVHLTVDVPTGPAIGVVLGRARDVVEGGFGGPPAGYGAPDAGGAWDAHTVEVPVVPDARNPTPTYPEMLRAAGITGRVLAEFVVDSTGRVRAGSIAIVESTHDLFASSVRRTVPSFRFTPARVRGQKVAQRVRVPFEFEMGR